MATQLPPCVKAVLWSYNTDQIDVELHKVRIITNILNLGTDAAVRWLFDMYPRQVIAEVVAHPRPGEWNRKSLNFWSLIFGVKPENHTRF